MWVPDPAHTLMHKHTHIQMSGSKYAVFFLFQVLNMVIHIGSMLSGWTTGLQNKILWTNYNKYLKIHPEGKNEEYNKNKS